MSNFHLNSAGGLSYATKQLPAAAEQRSEVLADVRAVCDGLQEICAKIRESWPERYPMPEELAMLLNFQDHALARLRSGTLRRFAEMCSE
jgi:hypothetical protein